MQITFKQMIEQSDAINAVEITVCDGSEYGWKPTQLF